MARAEGRTLAVILDNVSYHSSKRVRDFLPARPNLKLFPLPTYSPEYNPTEQAWRWSKPPVHAARTINGGLDELLFRFRKLMHARINGRLATPLNVGAGIWQCIYWIFMRIYLDRNRRRGEASDFEPAQKLFYRRRSCVERVFSALKDSFGCRKIMVEGAAKVMAHLMFAILALRVRQMCNFAVAPP